MLKLYWVTTEDHGEDWFIIAASNHEAGELHENLEGYSAGDATSEKVLDIPIGIPTEKGWPSEDLLKALGAKFYLTGDARVVEIAGRLFSEGLLESVVRTLNDDIFESQNLDRLNGSKKTSFQ